MFKEGVIKPAMLNWASPVVFAPKYDGKRHFYVDHRKLKAISVRETYLLLRMNE